ncbi:MAG TPA: NAD(P)H-dependent glycerol-3-phosphate dehydrogenase [Planctomycetaceae bacterium]|nr:NAD(P)H-dependent glycerol-3-phosphate dehydrogenase [Planctomycetaceae bacterium]HQZ68765.1 NAD(P)H-dependent glycerol-3-phosphate dehydrogenase [Planctomycetaceae bacterium]
MTNICVLGAGAMGTACAWVLAGNSDVSVRLWARNETFARHIHETRENSRLLPHVKLPVSIQVTADARQALHGASVVIVCVPTRGLRNAMQQLSPLIPDQALLVSAVKGIENDTLLRPSQIIQEIAGSRPVVVLGGPCHAEEITARKPASIVAACESLGPAEQIQTLLSTDFLRVYANADQLGVELAGALKNVIAIAAGICDGLKFGDNGKAALLTRGLAEMVRFGTALGAHTETFFGLAGLGDLVATCNSQHSRNRFVGEGLGRGQTLAEIQDSMAAVAEGIFTARSVWHLARERDIDMPIAEQVYRVLFEGKNPREATDELMQRPLKAE